MAEENQMKRERQNGGVLLSEGSLRPPSGLSASNWHKDLLISWLFRTSSRMQTSLDRCFLKFGMTLQEATVLLGCVQAGRIPPGHLAMILGKDKGKITRFIDRLEASRLVTREVLRRDRRFSIVKPTWKGRHVARDLTVVFDTIRHELFAGVMERDVLCVAQMLPALCGNAIRIGSQQKNDIKRWRKRIGSRIPDHQTGIPQARRRRPAEPTLGASLERAAAPSLRDVREADSSQIVRRARSSEETMASLLEREALV
jgi:DNA-binding MarR family transcriptional regulator